MLKKNKDYVEFTLQCTSVDWARSKDCPEVCLKGYSDFSFPGVPIMDVVCNEFDHKVVVVSKRDFEKMQADVNINAEIAKQWEINYDLLLKKIGFDTVEELVNYLDSEAECDTLREAIASLEYSVKFARDERRDLSKKLDECEKDYISERDKAEALQTENEQLKKKLQVPDPIQEYKELLEKLHSKEDVEKFEWTLNHICGGQASVNGWMVTAKLWRRNYETLSKLVGFSSTEEIQDYLTNEAECDTLQEAILKLKDQVKYTCDEWYSANSTNNSWKAAAECNSPKELIEKLNLLRDDISGRSTVTEHYKRDIEKWQKATGCLRPEDISTESMVSKSMANEIVTANEDLWSENEKCEKRIEALLSEIREWRETTGCPSPSAAKTLIESGASWMSAYHSSCEVIKTWKKLTGCPTPIAAKTLIESGMPYEYAYHEAQKENRKLTEEVDSWKNVTGYSTPEDYMHARISGAFHTPFDYTASWQDATGCVTPDQVKSRIEGLENAVRLTNRNLIKEIESNIDEWRKATGCSTPEQAKERIKALNERIDESEADYNHLLCTTGFESEGEIEDALDKCDHSTLRKALVDYEFDYENLLKLTGYKSEHDIRVALNYSEQFVYETLRELINSLKRKAKFTESGWQVATGRSDPEAAKQYIDRLKGRLNKIHGCSVDW